MNKPLETFDWKTSVTQLFGCNAEYYTTNFNLPAHNGIDLRVQGEKNGFGSPILAAHDGIVSKVVFDDFPLHTRGNGVYINTLDGKYATVYWHLATIEVTIGQKVSDGDKIGTLGNTGKVFPAPSKDNLWAGSHLHFAVYEYGKQNEYGGFIDPVPFLFKQGEKLPIILASDMFVGYHGDFVSWLQTCLKLEGYAQDYEPIGFFGMRTKRDVSKFQESNGISPVFGYCGRQTRDLLNKKFSSFI